MNKPFFSKLIIMGIIIAGFIAPTIFSYAETENTVLDLSGLYELPPDLKLLTVEDFTNLPSQTKSEHLEQVGVYLQQLESDTAFNLNKERTAQLLKNYLSTLSAEGQALDQESIDNRINEMVKEGQKNQAATKAAKPSACNPGRTGLGWLSWDCILLMIAKVAMMIVWLFRWILWGSNEIFNLVIQISVRDFGVYLNHPGVKAAWGVARDLVNVSLLFVLLYAAIGMIMNLASVDSKRIVTRVIMVALLVNFSFFFTGTVIKLSNTVANFLYNSAGGSQECNGSDSAKRNENCTKLGSPDITTNLLKGFVGNPSNLEIPGDQPEEYQQEYTLGNIIGNLLGTLILIIVTAVTLGAAALMFAVRFIKLIFLAVLSPLAFLGFAVPAFQEQAKKWSSNLINLSLFPIFFLLFLVMVSQIASAPTLWAFNANSGWPLVSSLIMAVIINGLMIAGLMAADKFGATGAAGAMGMLKKMKGGAVGLAGQRTLGKVGYLASKNSWVEKQAAKHPTFGMGLKNFSEKVAGAKFGGEGSYKKTIDTKVKQVEQFKDPARKAEFISNLGKQAQEAAYGKMKPEERAKLEKAVEEQRQGTFAEIPKDDKDLNRINSRLDRNKQSLGLIGHALTIQDKTTVKEGKERELVSLESKINSETDLNKKASLIAERDKKNAEIRSLNNEVTDLTAAVPEAANITREAERAKQELITQKESELARLNTKFASTSNSQEKLEIIKERQLKEKELNSLREKSGLVIKQETLNQEIISGEAAKKAVQTRLTADTRVGKRQNALQSLRNRLLSESEKRKIEDEKKFANDDIRLKELERNTNRSESEQNEYEKLSEQKRNRRLEAMEKELNSLKEKPEKEEGDKK